MSVIIYVNKNCTKFHLVGSSAKSCIHHFLEILHLLKFLEVLPPSLFFIIDLLHFLNFS